MLVTHHFKEDYLFLKILKMLFVNFLSQHFLFPLPADELQSTFTGESMTNNVRILMTSLYAVSFLVGFVGNTLGLYIICRKCGIKAATHLLIANLACSNLLITLIVMPMSIVFQYIEHRWHGGIGGSITCKLTQYLFLFPIATSILTILVVSIDRFFAVFYPLKGQVFRRPKIMTATIWICSAIVMSPTLGIFKVVSQAERTWSCVSYFGDDPKLADILSKVYYSLNFVILYLLPLLIISVLYALVCYKLYNRKIPGNSRAQVYKMAVEKSKRKVVKVLVMIVAAFALCWLPAHAMHYYVTFHRDVYLAMPPYVFPLLLWISHTNSAIDPCLYILLSQNFRREFRKVINQCGFYKKRKRFESRLSRLTGNFSKRNYETHRLSLRKSLKSGSNFWSFKKADPYRVGWSADQNGIDNAQHAKIFNGSPVAAESCRIKIHLDNHVS